jgi:transposase
MHEDYSIEKLANWQGFITGTVQRFEKGIKGARAQIWIELFPDELEDPRCSKCGLCCESIHDWQVRWVKDLPAWDAQTLLLVHYRRLNCEKCGKHVEDIVWLEPYVRVTKRLAESVARLCNTLPLKQAADFYDLDWHLVKRIHKRYLNRDYPDMDFSDVRILGMDEFAIKKGHCYATVFVDVENSRVLWICEGRSEENITPFFRDILREKGCLHIEAAVMDMWEAFENAVRKWCPHAEIVYDLFHIVKNFGKDVIDRVRIDATQKAEAKVDRKVIKGSKWILLSNKANLRKREDKVKLNELLKTNRDIYKAYVLK